jgi:hypothetical protein
VVSWRLYCSDCRVELAAARAPARHRWLRSRRSGRPAAASEGCGNRAKQAPTLKDLGFLFFTDSEAGVAAADRHFTHIRIREHAPVSAESGRRQREAIVAWWKGVGAARSSCRTFVASARRQWRQGCHDPGRAQLCHRSNGAEREASSLPRCRTRVSIPVRRRVHSRSIWHSYDLSWTGGHRSGNAPRWSKRQGGRKSKPAEWTQVARGTLNRYLLILNRVPIRLRPTGSSRLSQVSSTEKVFALAQDDGTLNAA